MFYLNVAYVCNVFSNVFRHFRKCFRQLFQVFHLFFMLQLLYLDVLKIDRVLHMGCVCEAAGSANDVRGAAWAMSGVTRPTASALALEPNMRGAHSLHVRATSER